MRRWAPGSTCSNQQAIVEIDAGRSTDELLGADSIRALDSTHSKPDGGCTDQMVNCRYIAALKTSAVSGTFRAHRGVHNDHRSAPLSEPVGWFSTTDSTPASEPTLSPSQLRSLTRESFVDLERVSWTKAL